MIYKSQMMIEHTPSWETILGKLKIYWYMIAIHALHVNISYGTKSKQLARHVPYVSICAALSSAQWMVIPSWKSAGSFDSSRKKISRSPFKSCMMLFWSINNGSKSTYSAIFSKQKVWVLIGPYWAHSWCPWINDPFQQAIKWLNSLLKSSISTVAVQETSTKPSPRRSWSEWSLTDAGGL